MENWKNVSVIIDKEEQKKYETLLFAKKLISACGKGDKVEVKKILKEGGSLNCCEENISPLIACIENEHLDLASFLIKIGASISYKPLNIHDDALWFALRSEAYQFVRLFVYEKCSFNKGDAGESVLMFATKKTSLEGVRQLLNHRFININERDDLGNTALHYNVMIQNPSQDDIEIGKLLLAAGADQNIVNFDGKTAFEVAGVEFEPIINKQDINNDLDDIVLKPSGNKHKI